MDLVFCGHLDISLHISVHLVSFVDDTQYCPDLQNNNDLETNQRKPGSPQGQEVTQMNMMAGAARSVRRHTHSDYTGIQFTVHHQTERQCQSYSGD